MLPIVGGLLPGISRVGRENQTVRRIARRLLHQDVPGGESIRELRKLCPELVRSADGFRQVQVAFGVEE